MGGHQTKLTVNASNESIMKAIFMAKQDCSTTATGVQSINLRGSNIIVDGVVMTQDMKINGSCVMDVVNDLQNDTDITNNVGQQIGNADVAGLEWMNAGKDNQETNISNVVRETAQTEILGKCVQQYLATQSINLRGSNIIIKNVKMDQMFSGISKCTLTAASSTKAATVLANKTNQGETNKAENPLSFLSDLMDSWGGAMGNLMAGATLPITIGVILIMIVVGISVFTGYQDKRGYARNDYLQGVAPPRLTANQQ